MFNQLNLKKNFSFALSFFIGALVFILLLRKAGLEKVLKALAMLSIWKGLIIFLFFLLGIVILTWRWKIILEYQGHKISFKKLFIAKIVGFSINHLTPILYTGGEFARAYVLKKEAKISYSEGLASVAIDKVLDVICGSLFFILGLFFILIQFEIPGYLLNPLLLIVIISLIFWVYFYIKLRDGKNLFSSIINFFGLNKINFIKKNKEKIVKLEDEIIKFFKYKKKVFLTTFSLSVLSMIIFLFHFKLILFFLNYNIPIKEIILAKIIFLIAYIIPIPVALGVLEATGAGIFIVLGLGIDVGITFALIIRALNLLLSGIGLFFLSRFGIKLTEVFFNNKNSSSDLNGKK
ncbi:MAG: hypothetical protein Athens101410_16 [Parcubacteria group bacterium Athens1014_10]|nr:MAG: hypothetical protein Athens101410_16 [Parcubacteria group bacterium Athens1014_10]TSD06042.1 MAG: hypothetical protein Athens071412_16 [Parcubacteria group bacterium Athens0714_12]